MNQYEITLLIRSNLKPTVLKETKIELEGILTQDRGVIVEINEIGERKLAYEIAHATHAYYLILLVTTTPRSIFEFKREVVIHQNVLRTLVLNTSKEPYYVQNLKLNQINVNEENFARITNNRYFLRKLYYRRALAKNVEGHAVDRSTPPEGNQSASSQ